MIPISKPFIGEAEKENILQTLESGMLAQGPRTAEFEARFAERCGVEHGIATSSGTSALYIALLAHDIGPGDEVITTPFTFIATLNTILMTGAKPVLVDIDPETFNIDPSQVESALTSRTKALLPVHLYGYLCDMDALQAIADQYDLAIIEDACQAVGGTFKGQKAGSFGTGTFSFYATKNIMTGEGGMITTDNANIAQTCRMIRNHGMEQRYHHEMLGFNFRMMDLQASLGLAQLERLEEFTQKRQSNADYFNTNITSVITPQVKDGYEHVWHQYTVLFSNGTRRDAAMQTLRDAGIGTGIYYPIPAHHQPHIREALGDLSLPVAEAYASQVLSLPIHPLLTEEDLDLIVEEVNKL
jgi:dTDP-4-amino-4,6-dideoxygalactose transaminase